MPGHSLIGRVATLDSSRVTCPLKPGSMKPAVAWVSSPSRPIELLPSTRAATSSGSVMTSYVLAERELARVQDERLVALGLDQAGEVRLVDRRVDVRVAVVLEHPEVAVEPDVDARRLDHRRVERLQLRCARPRRGHAGHGRRAARRQATGRRDRREGGASADRVAAEAAVRGQQGRGVLDGQAREVGIGDPVARRPGPSAQTEEQLAVPSHPRPSASRWGSRAGHAQSSAPGPAASGSRKTRGLVTSRRKPATVTPGTPTSSGPLRRLDSQLEVVVVARSLTAVRVDQDVDVNAQHQSPDPRRGPRAPRRCRRGRCLGGPLNRRRRSDGARVPLDSGRSSRARSASSMTEPTLCPDSAARAFARR